MLPKQFKTINLDRHDNTKLRRAVLDHTEKRYDEVLDQFDIFVQTHPGAMTPPDIKTYKGFMEWLATNTRGRLSEHGYPVLSTLDSKRRNFDTGLALRRGYEVPEEVSTTIREWMKKDLLKIVGISDLEMSRDGFSRDDLTIVLKHLWCYDDHEYRGKYVERTRLELSMSMLMYCFTSARTGEVHESTARRGLAREQGDSEDKNLRAAIMAACYKHFCLSIEWVDGVVMLVLTYERNFVKGYWRKHRSELPIHGFYEKFAKEVPLFLNLLTFFLPLASADQAFRDYRTVGEILDDVDIASLSVQGDDKVITIIEWKPEIKEVPIFRPYNEQDIEPSLHRARGADAFGKQFAALGHRAGYPDNINVRACRRWALMESDSKYSETARMKFAGQTKRDTFGKSYAHRVVEIDEAATFLGIHTRRDHIKNRRSMGMRRNPNLYQSLPAKAEFDFLHREDIIQLDFQIRSLLKEESMTERKLLSQRRRLETKRQRLYEDELKRVRSEQVRRLGTSSSHDQTWFAYARKVMPDRGLLADVPPTAVDLRSPTGRAALCALETICSQKYSVAYQSSITPDNDICPCGRQANKGRDAFAELCFACDVWYNNRSEWKQHCQEHLAKPQELVRCDPIRHRNALIRPGRCPFCLGDGRLDPRQRTKQYFDTSNWYKHVQSHFSDEALSGEFYCRHPACDEDFRSPLELYWHVEDLHCGKPPRRMKRALGA
ncbi:uncharacterized protein BDV17DRAFT_283674 [Aspergillus undulatus]|uniref:uncharacterized protein n=1 Tax=Aspergillus undulatus TaxID=1810928 RepID=UPI003CCDBCBD